MLHKIGPKEIAVLTFDGPKKPPVVEVLVEADVAVDVYVLTKGGLEAYEADANRLEVYAASKRKKVHGLTFKPSPRERWGLLIRNRTGKVATAYEAVRW